MRITLDQFFARRARKMSVIIQTVRIESEIRRLDDERIPIVVTYRVAVVEELARRRMVPAIHPDGATTIVVLIRYEYPIRPLFNMGWRRVGDEGW